MNKSDLKEIILSQQKRTYPSLIQREVFEKLVEYIKTPFIVIISGIRRAGKSTLLYQLQQKYSGYYLNFDDERLVNFTVADFQLLYETFIELYGSKNFFYFDEIQNIQGWERFVRRLHDERKKVYVTGSNASMLSKELGTHLTGRYVEVTIYPFSFKEFLALKSYIFLPHDLYVTEKKIQITKHFDEYFTQGGFPEYLTTKNTDYLKLLYDNILYRDIMARYNLSSEKALKELMYLLANSLAKKISFNSLKKSLQLGSSTTVKEYCTYLENSFLIYLVNTFSYSLKTQLYLDKKTYLVDTRLAVNLGFRMSQDVGRLLENLVFIELKRKKKEVYY